MSKSDMDKLNSLVEQYPNIVQNPKVMGGQPTIIKTRIRVVDVLYRLHQYESVEAVLDSWNFDGHICLSRENVLDCIAFAQDLLEISK